MKRFCFVLFLILLFKNAIAFESRSYLVVWAKDGTQVAYDFKEKPIVTFSENYLVITTESSQVSYSLGDYDHFSFEYEIPTDISSLDVNGNISVEDDHLIFLGIGAGARLKIYTLNGTILYDKLINNNGNYYLSMSNIPKGMFIVAIGKLIYKLQK